MDSSELNESGKNHVMEIAYRLQQGQQFPVVIEQSNMSPREGTEFEYPVHLNPALDMERRTAIATALGRLGIADAADRVVVAPATRRAASGRGHSAPTSAVSATSAGLVAWVVVSSADSVEVAGSAGWVGSVAAASFKTGTIAA